LTWVSQKRSTTMLSLSSVSSSPGVVTSVTSVELVRLVVSAPARCTVALSAYPTWPNSHVMLGGSVAGTVIEIGYVYVPALNSFQPSPTTSDPPPPLEPCRSSSEPSRSPWLEWCPTTSASRSALSAVLRPRDWLRMRDDDEPARASGLLVRRGTAGACSSSAAVAALPLPLRARLELLPRRTSVMPLRVKRAPREMDRPPPPPLEPELLLSALGSADGRSVLLDSRRVVVADEDDVRRRRSVPVALDAAGDMAWRDVLLRD